MSGAGGGDPREPRADQALPAELASQSLSATVLIVPLAAALAAIAFHAQQGRRLESWEGWVKLRDGSRAKSLTHGGSFALPGDAAQAAQTAEAGMRRAQERWNRNPEYDGGELYFGLYFARA